MPFQFGQLVVVRREKRLCAGFLLVAQVLHHRPRNRQAVKRAGAAPDFIQNDEGFCGRVAQDVRRFAHLHHERGLSAGEVIRRADAGENAVGDGDFRFLRRDERPDVRHQRNQRHLPHVGAFARHVRPGDDAHAAVISIHVRVVGHESALAHRLLDDRVASLDNVQRAILRHFGADVVVLYRRFRQRQQRVQRFERHRRLLDARNLLRDFLAHLGEQLQFQARGLLLRADDFLLDFLQLRRHVALAVRQGLLADIARRHHFVIRLADLDVVAKHAVVLDTQVADARLLALLLLQLQNPLLAARGRGAVLIQHLGIPIADDAALGDENRRVGVNRAGQQVGQLRQGIQRIADFLHRLTFRLAQQLTDFRHLLQRRAQRQAIPRVHRLIGDLRQQALNVVHALQFLRERHRQHMFLRKLAHRVQPAVDFFLIYQRLLNPRAQQTAAHRRAGFVQQPEQAPLAASPADGFRQFQISPRVAVKQHRFAALINAQAGHVLQRVLLRLGQIPHQCARSTRARLVLIAETQRRQVIEREMAAERFRRVRQLKPRARLL